MYVQLMSSIRQMLIVSFGVLTLQSFTPRVFATEKPPEFSDHLTAQIYNGPIQLPRFDTRDRIFREYRTLIRRAVKVGPDFAGKYSVAMFKSGGVGLVFIIDVASGAVHPFPGPETDGMPRGFYLLTLDYKVRSRLLKASWALHNEDGECFSVNGYYEWKSAHAELLFEEKTKGFPPCD